MLSKGGVFIDAQEISFGDNVFISRNFHIAATNLTFGDNIMIGPNLVIECHNHRFDVVGKAMFEYGHIKNHGFVTIENDVWIGANVIVLPNVTISEGCVVGAGSVVNKTIPPYSVCVGVPCKALKKRFSDEELKNHLQLIKSKYSFNEIKNEWLKYNL